ncbi:MAG: transcriptional repressor LexA [Treponema sp.]|nr:transcriptional repressor LexA [Treponema sp.]
MKELTLRQKEILSFVKKYISSHSYPPTIREIAAYFSITAKGAHDHITALRKKGALKQTGKCMRTIGLVKDQEEENSEKCMEIPILGTVAAGQPILSEENWDGTISVHQSLLKKNKKYFALKVRGDSMTGIGIMDGDTAVIEKQSVVKNGDIAVAVIDEAVTLKRFFRENNRVRLQAENPAYKPIYTQNARVLGRLAQVLRFY